MPVDSNSSSQKSAKGALFTLLFIVFLDLLGFGIAIPVMALLFLGSNSVASGYGIRPEILYGFLLATYPITQFFGAPVLGALSDRFGRKKMLLVSLIGTLVARAMFAIGVITNNLLLLFASRAVDGFTGGNISVAQSAIADLSDEKTKAANFGLIGFAFGMGFILGPYLGGKLADNSFVSWFNNVTPFWFAAALEAVAIVLLLWKFDETLKEKIPAKVSFWTGFANLGKAIAMPSLASMFTVVFLYTLGVNFFTQFFQVFLIEKFAFKEAQIGELYAFMGVCIAITLGFVTRSLAKKFKPTKILSYSLALLAVALPFLLVPAQAAGLYLVIPFISLSNGLTQPNSVAVVSSLGDRKSQGELLGINQSVQAAGMALPPIIAGFISTINSSLPILAGSACVALAWLVFTFNFKPQNKHLFSEFQQQ